jgi:nifR3 family TIM-barrel protein
MLPLRIGDFTPAVPVVLAPMAGVTNAAFRSMCRDYGPDLIYVNEMVMSTAVVHRNDKTEQMMRFGPDEAPRSLQLYGSDPAMLGRAVHLVCDEGIVDHVDLNFGCPAAKVTRKGGGAAVPAKPALLRQILRAAVGAARPYGVPVTAKFRMGLRDDLRTDITTGLIAADEGVAWIALHARTVEQHYSGEARWDAIAELKQAVDGIPVLGNGDIWEASDAVAMMNHTGCDGVVIGRGCLGRPWLFGDLVTTLSGGPVGRQVARLDARVRGRRHGRVRGRGRVRVRVRVRVRGRGRGRGRGVHGDPLVVSGREHCSLFAVNHDPIRISRAVLSQLAVPSGTLAGWQPPHAVSDAPTSPTRSWTPLAASSARWVPQGCRCARSPARSAWSRPPSTAMSRVATTC